MKQIKLYIKIVKNLLIGFCIGSLLVIVLAVFIANMYGERVKKFVLAQLNNQLKTEIKVSNLNFSLLRKFPKASLDLQNVYILSPEDFMNKHYVPAAFDTLVYAEHLFLQFNIFDLLNRKYKLENIHFINGEVNLYISRYGKANYDIFKETDNSANNDSFKIDLSKVRANNILFLYSNNATNQKIETQLREARFSGNFSSNNFELQASGDLLLNEYTSENITYFKNKNLIADIELSVDGNKYSIIKSNIKIESINVELTGDVTDSKSMFLNLGFRGKNVDIHSLVDVIPPHLATY